MFLHGSVHFMTYLILVIDLIYSSLFTIYGTQKKHTQINKQTDNRQTEYKITQ